MIHAVCALAGHPLHHISLWFAVIITIIVLDHAWEEGCMIDQAGCPVTVLYAVQ